MQVTQVHRAPIEETVTAEAVVFPLQQAVVTPKITSTIKSFLVQRGSRVRKGQLLVILENADLSAAAVQSKGELEQAEAGYTTTTKASLPQMIQKAELDATAAKAALDAQQKVYDSRKVLFQQGALPRRDLDSADVALVQARSQAEMAQKQLGDLKLIGEKEALKSASGQLSAARGKYLGAEAEVAYSEIRSPIDGVVTDRPQYVGELATANQPLLTVMDISQLVAKCHIGQAEASLLKVGDPAEIEIAGADKPIEGRVSLVSPAVDAGSTTIEVWVESRGVGTNPGLKPGLTVRLSMVAQSSSDALVVPVTALFRNEDGKDYVMLASPGNHAEMRVVEAGIRTPEVVQIKDGLKEGDSVITGGGYALPDKTPIKVENSAQKAPVKTATDSSEKDKD